MYIVFCVMDSVLIYSLAGYSKENISMYSVILSI